MYFGLRKWEFVTPTTLDIPGAGARIDLSRADQLDSDRGWAIVQQETPIGSDGVSLGQGDTLRDVLCDQTLRDAWSSTLGTTPDGDTLDELLWDHLESKSDPKGIDTARPLELASGRLEVWLGIRQIEVVPFASGTTRERAAFVRMVQRIRSRLNDARTASTEGRIPANMYRKLLVMEARKIANSISITDGLTDPPVVTSNSASGQVGTAFSYQIVGTNTPTEYAASELPSGLSVNTTTGLITGNPTQSGTFSIPISATNAGGTGTGTLTLVIAPAPSTSSLQPMMAMHS